MKKLLFTISIICYLAVTTGIVINSHYCMKSLVSIHLFESKAKSCGKCGMDYHESNDCCRDEMKLVKLDQDQNQLIFVHPGINKLEPPVTVLSDYLAFPVMADRIVPHFFNHSPPLLPGQDRCLLNRVFRI